LDLLGTEPEVADLPEPPSEPEPGTNNVHVATGFITAAAKDQDTDEVRAAHRARLEAAVTTAKQAHVKAVAAAAHAAALVDATRTAPSLALTGAVDGLARDGVTVRLDGDTAQVCVDGRRWKKASHGRQIAADLSFRAALRKASGMTYLPLWVDDAHGWSRELPKCEGEVVVLRTGVANGT